MLRKTRKIIAIITIASFLILPATVKVGAVATTVFGASYSTNRYYIFQNVHSGKFLEVADGNLSSGANVWQDTFEYDTNQAQVFRLLEASEDDIGSVGAGEEYFCVKPITNHSLYLDVDNANNSNGANIKVFGYNPGHGAQSFMFIDNLDGSFRIEPYLSRESGRVLTVVDASTANKANVVLSTWTGDTSQRWVVKEIDPIKDEELINLNWSYFFRDAAGSTYRRIYRRMNLARGENWHVGTDIPTNGTANIPFYSPCSGTVIDCGYRSSMGYYAMIRTNTTIQTEDGEKRLIIRVMHMNEPAEVSEGEAITKNKKIGKVGYEGTGSTGYHLHVDVNSGGYKWGEELSNDPTALINVETMFLSKRFRYGRESERIYATDVVF